MPLILNGQTGVKITDAAGKIGIGTTNPGSRLTVSRDSEAAEGQIQLRNTGGISAGNYDGIFFTQGSTGQTPLASMRVKYQNNGHPDIGFFTRNTSASTTEIERVGISNAGYVTMPYQPAFQTNGAGYSNSENQIRAINPSALVNIGSHYNATNGRFTAPIAGKYKFHFLYTTASANAAAPSLYFRINGSGVHGRVLNYYTQYSSTSAHVLFNLNSGDYVEAIIESWNSVATTAWETSWGGYLLG
jgi:hypothetical protein